jgi:hypothetical protein
MFVAKTLLFVKYLEFYQYNIDVLVGGHVSGIPRNFLKARERAERMYSASREGAESFSLSG